MTNVFNNNLIVFKPVIRLRLESTAVSWGEGCKNKSRSYEVPQSRKQFAATESSGRKSENN